MTGELPRQARRCTRFSWCGGHVRGADVEHRAAPVEVPAQEGRTLLLSLVADANGPPRVEVEVLLEPGDLPMAVATLDPADVVITSTALRRLALLSQQQPSQGHPVPAE